MRPCLTCGRPTRNGARCPAHATNTRRVYNSSEYRSARATLIASAIRCHWCGHPFTVDDPATADHDPPLAHDPTNNHLVAAHRSCNSRRGATTRVA
jgi:hypothetical protein